MKAVSHSLALFIFLNAGHHVVEVKHHFYIMFRSILDPLNTFSFLRFDFLIQTYVLDWESARSDFYGNMPTFQLAPSPPGLAVTASEYHHYKAVFESVLGTEEGEEEWFKGAESTVEDSEALSVLARMTGASSSEKGSGALTLSSSKSQKQAW
ncbi:hypothetical protein BDN67DRAFT_1013079 [Paxillus ammoniavirescens]|nr:hypothetical protein BDN67DRAFT_1013079 [Paxillus ammoniavirescens]